ncbi:uncharacterized protein LOC101744645 isoform X2 [Bombyx mori]|uniref:LisH domain-containing protein n=1 Tax=Bombyx mori TaxID=7091 RepID=A0A8R1WGB4_BOMMO|nr:uncharacterized protein LOC101744645 isoform X2 [Bombyx mori]
MEEFNLNVDRASIEEQNETKQSDSAENFQKFMYNLFERNGVINDLRAYLRGHIVDVLKCARTGTPLECQKHFAQRLELTYQAMNMLISEYLLRLEFNYTLSVFVSEIPLANMVFGFAKTLMDHSSDDYSGLRLKENDVWSIINYLGIKCDSEYASRIVYLYRSREDIPLLMCIIQCNAKYQIEEGIEKEHPSKESVASIKASDTEDGSTDCSRYAPMEESCKHYAYCKTCQDNIKKVKGRYKEKKESFVESLNESQNNPINTELMMRNIDLMEKSLLDEMFKQLKEVYETEVQMLREEEEKKRKRLLAGHAQQLQEKCDELEETYRSREAKLETNIREKKKFLWGLARSLRDQHAHVARAMTHLKQETDRLRLKEENLRVKVAEAETLLRERAEEMRTQISNELVTLSRHLDTMRTEREAINKERDELQQLKISKNSNNIDKDLGSRYDSLRDEISILKRYIESNKLKCTAEKSTITDSGDVHVLNNSNDVGCDRSDGKVKDSNVVNDLKRLKNVNFCQASVYDVKREPSRDRGESSSRRTIESEFRYVERLLRLQEENNRLRMISQQACAISQAPLMCPSQRYNHEPAPGVMRSEPGYTRISPSGASNASHVAHHQGSGEELSWFATTRPRVLLPGDLVPFIGVVASRIGADTRAKYPQRASPARRDPPAPRDPPGSRGRSRDSELLGNTDDVPGLIPDEPRIVRMSRDDHPSPAPPPTETSHSAPRAARRKLKSNETKLPRRASHTDECPSSVLREAKLRLRKLEIEAEAVQMSYLQFRGRSSQEKNRAGPRLGTALGLDTKRSKSLQQVNSQDKLEFERKQIEEDLKRDIDKHLKQYATKLDVIDTRFKNRTTSSIAAAPVPAGHSALQDNELNNYLETPLSEFRKYYQTDRILRNGNANARKQNIDLDAQNNSSDIGSVPSKDNVVHSSADIDEINRVKVIEKQSGDYNNEEDNELAKETLNSEILIDNEKSKTMMLSAVTKSVSDDTKADEVLNEIIETNSLMIETVQAVPISEGDVKTQCIETVPSAEPIEINITDNNLLRVEIESEDVGNKDSKTEMSVLVSPQSEVDYSLSPRMTILVSPKRGIPGESTYKLADPDLEGSANVLDSIFKANDEAASSVDLQIELEKEGDSLSEGRTGDKDYGDDFSADVDNYNSRSSDFEIDSPVSLPKTYEDEQFWDS